MYARLMHKLSTVIYYHADLNIGEKPATEEQLEQACQDTIRYSVKTGHPRFFNQLFGGLDQYALAGTWITEALNTSQYTFEVAPVFTMTEHVVIQKMLGLIGFPEGDGIFCPGGSISNMYGLHLARFKKFPNVKTMGMQGLPQMLVYTSDQGHYSLMKGASLLGLGTNNVIKMATDDVGRMLPAALDQAITEAKTRGSCPLMVSATCGTTVLGSYDNLMSIADVCEKHQVWMHVDGCWGGAALLSRRHRGLLEGIERADSVAWNPHKMFGAPLQCSALLLKEKGLLHHCNCAGATYLFQQDKFYDVSYDTGDKSVQCGRKVDVFKLWLYWKAKGDRGAEQLIDNAYSNAAYLASS
ncbi:PREDICTED: cysteine sulfinic acid decarboxylase-like [Priapulus caudatus]|uniref:Cysteine sulfinic acid decarboxylase-like n=1 Tax=Priapulus caudatus TaxID=37621 RepID=A0ABM1F963_PRICU|nr:PREDICTED: cysteine sulfinic acid decarboxylase-like [Priapulus caudatus]